MTFRLDYTGITHKRKRVIAMKPVIKPFEVEILLLAPSLKETEAVL